MHGLYRFIVLIWAVVVASRAQTFSTLVNLNGNTGTYPGYVSLAYGPGSMSLVQGTDGSLYGTTSSGGTSLFAGTVFKITLAGVLTTLHSFDGTDGSVPTAGLVLANDGSFYGTTITGGTEGTGTIFKITAEGVLTTLYNFEVRGTPIAPLVQSIDGMFFGTSYGKLGTSDGTIFNMTPEGTLTTLHRFNGTDGAAPSAGLVQAKDGAFYGTTRESSCGTGTIFKISPDGTFTTLKNCGIDSAAALIQASDGYLYGTTQSGGHTATAQSSE